MVLDRSGTGLGGGFCFFVFIPGTRYSTLGMVESMSLKSRPSV